MLSSQPMENHQQGPRSARPQTGQSSPIGTISSRRHILNCQNLDPSGSSAKPSDVDLRKIAQPHVLNYRPTAMKWPFLVALVFASMTILALNIVALVVLPPDDGAHSNLSRRDISTMNNPEPKEKPEVAPSQSGANAERRLLGGNECGTVTVTIAGSSEDQKTTMTSFTTIILTQLVRREINASSPSVTPTLSLSPPPCVPVTVTWTKPVEEAGGVPYMTIGTLTLTRTLYRPVKIPEGVQETKTDGSMTLYNTATNTRVFFPTDTPKSPMGGPKGRHPSHHGARGNHYNNQPSKSDFWSRR